MVELQQQWTKRRFDIEKIDNKAALGINWPFQLQVNPVGMTMKIEALVIAGDAR